MSFPPAVGTSLGRWAPAESRWTLIALAVALAVGAIDLLTPPHLVFVTLLVAPPLIAAARVRPSITCWIALLSLVESLALGMPANIWLSPDHLIRTASVLLAGVLAVGLAMGRRDTERALGAAYRISQAAQSATTLQELFKAIHDIVSELMPALNFYIALCDAERTTLSFPYFVDEFDPPPAPKAPGRGLTEYVLRTGEPLLGTPEVFEDLVRRGEVELIGAPSIDWMGVPLQVAGTTIGVLVVQSYTERVRYSERQKKALQFVSAQVAMAIQRKRVEEALRAGEEQYRSLVEVAPDLIAVHSEGKIVFVNSAGARLLGAASPDELIGRRVMDFVHADSRPVVVERIRAMMEHRETVPVIIEKFVRLDGTAIPVEVAAAPFEYRGRPAVQVVARDITERLRAETALRESEARLSQAQATAHLGAWELDLTDQEDVNRNPLWWSDETFRIFGYQPGQVPVTNDLFFSHVPADDRPRIEAAVAQALRERGRYFLEHRVTRPDGTERVVQEQATVVTGAGGRPLRMLGTVLDVTDQRKLEEQLRQVQKMEAVGQLAGGIAHDFNNLLTTILTMSQMLKSELPQDAKYQADLDSIRAAAQHGSDLTRKLLTFSRRQRLQLRSVAVGPLVEEFTRMARRVVPEDVEVAVELEARDVAVHADPAAVEQILMNLVTNARDAMPAGGRLVIRVARAALTESERREQGLPAAGEYADISVRDTGTGMDAEIQQRMFEPFFTTKPVGQGTGLGMPTVYGLVKEHGGLVQVSSEVGRGTTVRVLLPATPGTGASAGPSSDVLRGGSETILLVEDDESLRRAGTRVLTKYGYTVITAADGFEALNIMQTRERPPDLIVSDVVMPHTSGPQLLQALRDAGQSPRILFTSGYTARDVHERTPLEPDVPFLAKPWTITDLVRRVREVLDAPVAT